MKQVLEITQSSPNGQGSALQRVYLDNNATTAPSPVILQEIGEVLNNWGNPSSIHWAGQAAKNLVREARLKLAQALSVNPLELVFTSGATESNNAIIKNIWQQVAGSKKSEFITTEVEHPSVAKTFQWIESQGGVVHYLKVDRNGRIDLKQYQQVLNHKICLASVMFANNETGVVFPIKEMSAAAHAAGAVFHSDCVQALGKTKINLQELGIDYASFSAHKFYALKGTGLMYIKKGSSFAGQSLGGSQERARRGGTENTIGIWAMGRMAQELVHLENKENEIRKLRNIFESKIKNQISGVSITSELAPRLANTSSLVIDGIDGETLLMALDLEGFAVSTGAACSSGNPEPSPVLLAMGLSRQEAQKSLRVSIGWQNTEEQILNFVSVLGKVVTRLREINQKVNPSQFNEVSL